MIDPLNQNGVKEAIELGKTLKNPDIKDKLFGHILDQKIGTQATVSSCPVNHPCKNHIPIIVETVSQTLDGNEINSDTALLDNEKDLRGLYEFLCHIHRLSSGPLIGIEILEATDTEVKNEALFSFDFKQQCSTYFKRMNKVAFPGDVPEPPVYMYFAVEANNTMDHIGKLKVIDDIIMFINNKAYFSLPFTKEEAEGVCKFLHFIQYNNIVDTIGDISNIETYCSKDWEEQLELEQINQKEWAKADEDI